MTISSYPSNPIHARLVHHTLDIDGPLVSPVEKRPVVMVVAPDLSRLVNSGADEV